MTYDVIPFRGGYFMLNFCLGFVFDSNQEQVLLLKKRAKDKFNPDCWNGVGGHIEENESSIQAMSRECLEETGLNIAIDNWHPLGQISDGKSFCVDVFVSIGPIENAQQTTDEQLAVFSRQNGHQLNFAADVDKILAPWLSGNSLVPIAQ